MVSIIIPVYNGQMYLEKTIRSCINQTYKDIEIIITDDCSTDHSVEIALSIAEYDHRVHILTSIENSGFCKNNNRGLNIAKGEFVILLGQDDLLPNDHIEKVLSCFPDDAAMVFCYYAQINENDTVLKHVKKDKKEILVEDLLYRNIIPSCGAVIRKASLVAVGGYPEIDNFPNYGEWYLWIKLLTQGRIVLCEDAIPLYRRHQNNISNSFNDSKKKIRLNHYWNKCRLLAAKNCKHKICSYTKVLIFKCYKSFLREMKRGQINDHA